MVPMVGQKILKDARAKAVVKDALEHAEIWRIGRCHPERLHLCKSVAWYQDASGLQHANQWWSGIV